MHRYAYAKSPKIKLFFLIFHAFYKLIFSKYYLLNDKSVIKNASFIFFKKMHRADYDELFNQIFDCCQHQKSSLEMSTKIGFSYYYLRFFKFYKHLIVRISANNFIEKIYLFLSFINYLKVLEFFDNLSFNNLVVFADMQPEDNLLVQFFKNSKITITLQHGLFVDYEESFNISSVQYKNVTSRYFLTWGNENKKLIQKYSRHVNVRICGNPTMKEFNYQHNNSSDFFTVFLDWDVFENENRLLLEIAGKLSKKINKKILIRYHPSNKKKLYSTNDLSLKIQADYYDSFFLLGHTSSMIHKCLRWGMPIFKLKTRIHSNPIDKNYEFSNVEDLLEKIKNLQNFQKIKKNNIGYIGEESKNKYRKFFNEIYEKI